MTYKCWVSFCCTEKWFNYTYVFFLVFFSVMAFYHRVLNIVLCTLKKDLVVWPQFIFVYCTIAYFFRFNDISFKSMKSEEFIFFLWYLGYLPWCYPCVKSVSLSFWEKFNIIKSSNICLLGPLIATHSCQNSRHAKANRLKYNNFQLYSLLLYKIPFLKDLKCKTHSCEE